MSGSSRKICQLREVGADALEHAPCPPCSSCTNTTPAPQAAVVTTAARTNGAGRPDLEQDPPPTSAEPSARRAARAATLWARP